MVQKDNQKIAAIGIAIFLSLLLWIYVMGEQNPVQTRTIDNVKVSLENIDNITRNNLVLLPKQDFTVSISVTGRLKDLVMAKAEDFKLEADMGGYIKKGENSIPITVKSLPKGLTSSGEEMPKVNVRLDNLSTKYVPINISVTGEAKEGYEYVHPTSNPAGVMISGAKSYVEEVSKVIGKVNITGLDNNTTKTISLEPINAEEKVVTNVSIEPKFVDVTVNIAPCKEVPINVKTTGSLGKGVTLESITPKLATVKIIGDKNIIDKVKFIDTQVFDIASVKETVTKEIKLKIPNGVSIQSDINSVGVEFKISPALVKNFISPLNMIGRHEGYTYELSVSSVSLNINGEHEDIDKLNTEDIYCYVDVSSMKEGENPVEVKVKLKESFTVSQISPSTVKVTVKKST